MNFDGTTDDALGQRVVVFKIVHRVLRVLCVSVSSVFKQTRRLRSCMTSSRAVGRCVRHRGHRDRHRDTEDTEEFRDFASTTLPTTDGRICCLAITAGGPRTAGGPFVFTPSASPRRHTPGWGPAGGAPFFSGLPRPAVNRGLFLRVCHPRGAVFASNAL